MEFQARKQFHRNNAFVMAAFTIGRLSGRTTSGDLNNPNVLANAIGEVGGGHLSASPQRRVHPSRSRQSIRKLSVSNWSAIHAVLHREHDDRSGIDPADISLNLVKPGPERLPNLNLLDCSTWRFSRPVSVTERLRFEPMADLYNGLNVYTPYSEVTTVAPNLGHYSANTEGRILKGGLKVDF